MFHILQQETIFAPFKFTVGKAQTVKNHHHLFYNASCHSELTYIGQPSTMLLLNEYALVKMLPFTLLLMIYFNFITSPPLTIKNIFYYFNFNQTFPYYFSVDYYFSSTYSYATTSICAYLYGTNSYFPLPPTLPLIALII